MLFIAESTVFATFGAVAGYLLGQVSYLFIVQYELLSGLTLNYSSLSAVWATVVVILTVYVSTLYPARLAANMAVLDVTRQWRFPPPQGDDWRFDFPFTVGGSEVPSMYVYLKTVFDAYGEGSVGDFIARDVALHSAETSDGTAYAIAMKAWRSALRFGHQSGRDAARDSHRRAQYLQNRSAYSSTQRRHGLVAAHEPQLPQRAA